MSLLTALLGCTAQPPPTLATLTVPETPIVTDPSPWTFPDAEADPGPVDPAALGAALDAAVVAALAYPASPLIDAYLARYAPNAAAPCPGAVDDGAGNVYWANGCTAADGTYFGGYVTWSRFVDLYSDGALFTGDTVSGNIALIDPDGGTLDLEGTAGRLTGTSTDGTTEYVQTALVGGFALDAADAEGWLLGGMQSIELVVTGIAVPAVGGRVTVVDGALVPRLGQDGSSADVYSVRFTGATMADAVLGAACDREPGGGVVVRDPAGRWVEVTFHGPVLDGDLGDPSRCDGCGDAVLLSDGTPVGQVCADFGPWLTSEVTP